MTHVYRLRGGFSGGKVPISGTYVSRRDHKSVQRCIFVNADEALVFWEYDIAAAEKIEGQREESGETIRNVKDGIDRLIGETGRLAVMYHVEATSGLSEDQIPYNLPKFVIALKQIFGIGAKLIVDAIFEQMRSVSADNAQFFQFVKAMELAAN